MGYYLTNVTPSTAIENAVFEANSYTGLKIEIEKKPMPADIGDSHGEYSPTSFAARGLWSLWNPHGREVSLSDWYDVFDKHKHQKEY